MNKCATFTLPPIDDTLNNSALLLSGRFKNQNYFKNLNQEFAARLAKVHRTAKEKSIQMKELFAGRRIF